MIQSFLIQMDILAILENINSTEVRENDFTVPKSEFTASATIGEEVDHPG